MARSAKDHKNISIKCDTAVYDQLEKFCVMTGQNKTAVIERAVSQYIAAHIDRARQIDKMLSDM